MILFNPTERKVEFRRGGKNYIFKPKESRDLPDIIAEHAIKRVHAPLVKQTSEYDSQVEITDVVYSELPWKKLVQMASARGVFKPRTKRPAVEKAMEEYDEKARALPKSSS